MNTTSVGIREIKKNLSKYLQNVEKGNGVIVSNRGIKNYNLAQFEEFVKLVAQIFFLIWFMRPPSSNSSCMKGGMGWVL